MLELLIERINFSALSQENEFIFIDTIGRLKNKEALTYLQGLKSSETDPEVIDDINICLSNLII